MRDMHPFKLALIYSCSATGEASILGGVVRFWRRDGACEGSRGCQEAGSDIPRQDRTGEHLGLWEYASVLFRDLQELIVTQVGVYDVLLQLRKRKRQKTNVLGSICGAYNSRLGISDIFQAAHEFPAGGINGLTSLRLRETASFSSGFLRSA